MKIKDSSFHKIFSIVFATIKLYTEVLLFIGLFIIDKPLESPFIRTLIIIFISNIIDKIIIWYYKRKATRDNYMDMAKLAADKLTWYQLYTTIAQRTLFLNIANMYYRKVTKIER